MKKKPEPYNNTSLGIALGLCLGSGLGIVFDNLAIGISIGLCFGISIGTILDNQKLNNNKKAVVEHYDKLIEEGNDPVNDPDILKEHMDKWDGEIFINNLDLSPQKSVLEIGVGTGRLAVKVCGYCKHFTGIDFSPLTIERAKEHLSEYNNVTLICDDFNSHKFNETYDIIYSSLTFMHLPDKLASIYKVKKLLNDKGVFVLSIDKNPDIELVYNERKIEIYPSQSQEIITAIKSTKLNIESTQETEFAYIFTAKKEV